MKQNMSFYSKEKRDEYYYAYLTPLQKGIERFLNVFYIIVMVLTFVAAFIIPPLARSDETMTFFGMVICEACLVIMKMNTIPLFDIQFHDHKKKPSVTVRENIVLIWVGLGFLMMVGYLMMAVGVVNAIERFNGG